MKLKEFIEMYDPSERDFKVEHLGDDEINRIVEITQAKMISSKPRRRIKMKISLIAAVVVVAMTTTVFALGTNLGLFQRVMGSDANQYIGNINEVGEDTALVVRPDYTISIYSTIFTDNDVYAIVAVKGKTVTPEDISINGRIVYNDHDQTAFGLAGNVKTIQPDDGDAGMQYFLFSATIAETRISNNGELVIAAGNNFLKLNSLRDFEGDKLELSITLGGTESILTATVSKVSTEALTFHPDPSLYEGEFYDTILLTPYELKMNGHSDKSEKELLQAQELPWYDPCWYWFQPDITITIILTDGTEITMASSVSAQIAASKAGSGTGLLYDKNHLIGGSASGDPTTGEFSFDFNFREWQIDLATVAGVIINGVRYEIVR